MKRMPTAVGFEIEPPYLYTEPTPNDKRRPVPADEPVDADKPPLEPPKQHRYVQKQCH